MKNNSAILLVVVLVISSCTNDVVVTEEKVPGTPEAAITASPVNTEEPEPTFTSEPEFTSSLGLGIAEVKGGVEDLINSEISFLTDVNGGMVLEGYYEYLDIQVFLYKVEQECVGIMLLMIENGIVADEQNLFFARILSEYVNLDSVAWMAENWPRAINEPNYGVFDRDSNDISVRLSRIYSDAYLLLITDPEMLDVIESGLDETVSLGLSRVVSSGPFFLGMRSLDEIGYYAVSSLSGERIQVSFKRDEGFSDEYSYYVELNGNVIRCSISQENEKLLLCVGTDTTAGSADEVPVSLYVNDYSEPIFEVSISPPSTISSQSSSGSSDGGSDGRY